MLQRKRLKVVQVWVGEIQVKVVKCDRVFVGEEDEKQKNWTKFYFRHFQVLEIINQSLFLSFSVRNKSTKFTIPTENENYFDVTKIFKRLFTLDGGDVWKGADADAAVDVSNDTDDDRVPVSLVPHSSFFHLGHLDSWVVWHSALNIGMLGYALDCEFVPWCWPTFYRPQEQHIHCFMILFGLFYFIL